MSRKIAVSGRKTIAGTESARSCRSQFAGAVLRMRRGKWRRHYRRILRVSCERIPRRAERGLPDENQKPTLQFAFGLETPDCQQIQQDILVILSFYVPILST